MQMSICDRLRAVDWFDEIANWIASIIVFGIWMLMAWGLSHLPIGISTDQWMLYMLAFAFIEKLGMDR